MKNILNKILDAVKRKLADKFLNTIIKLSWEKIRGEIEDWLTESVFVRFIDFCQDFLLKIYKKEYKKYAREHYDLYGDFNI